MIGLLPALLLPLAAGLSGALAARRFAWAPVVAASLAGLLGLWASTGFPAFPPELHVEILAWGMLPLGLAERARWKTWMRGSLGLGLLAWIQWQVGMDFWWLGILGLGAAFSLPQGANRSERMEGLGLGLLSMMALYAGDSLRLGLLALGMGLGMAAAGGGSRVWMALMAGIGVSYAGLSDGLALALVTLGIAGLRHPAGWVAGLYVLGRAAQGERL